MNHKTSLLSSLMVLALLGVADSARSDSTKKPPTSVVQQPPVRFNPTPDKVRVSKLQVSGDAVKTVTLEIANVSNDAALWMPWSLKWKSGSVEKYLGLGSIDSLNGGQSKTFTFEFLPPAGNGSLEASIDWAHKAEPDSAMWSTNTKTVSVTGSAPPSGKQLVAYEPGQATGLVHEYIPRTGMTGCTMTHAPNGPTLSVNMTCTAEGAGELVLFKGATLKNGFKLNSVAIGQLGGGKVEPRRVSLAGGTGLEMRISVGGQQGSAPVVFVTLEVVGPTGVLPY